MFNHKLLNMIVQSVYIDKAGEYTIEITQEAGCADVIAVRPIPPITSKDWIAVSRKIVEMSDAINAPKPAEETAWYWKKQYDKQIELYKKLLNDYNRMCANPSTFPDSAPIHAANDKPSEDMPNSEPHGVMDC